MALAKVFQKCCNWTQSRVLIPQCKYPMRLFSLSCTKGIGEWASEIYRKKGVFSRIQRDKNGSASGAHKGAMSVQSDRSIVICVLYAGTFLLDTGMKSASLFHVPVTIQSAQVLTQAYSPSVYPFSTTISYLICLHWVIHN
jgi:hypothetical protein